MHGPWREDKSWNSFQDTGERLAIGALFVKILTSDPNVSFHGVPKETDKRVLWLEVFSCQEEDIKPSTPICPGISQWRWE